MRIKFKAKLLALAILILLATACKKDRSVNQNSQLVGSWTETPLDAQFQRTFFFGDDGSFTLHSTYVGTTPSGSTLNGTYQVTGDQLVIKITEDIGVTKGFPLTTTKVNYTLLDKATFSITGNKLKINYVSYPADAPIPTVMVLLKN